MNYYFNFIGSDGKKVHCFDKFQTFIHHRRAVHADFCAHVPFRVRNSHDRRCVFNFLAAFSAEGTARACEQDTLERPVSALSLKALENRGVFAVHRYNFRALFCGAPHNNFTAADKGFLVGKRYSMSLVNCGQGGNQSD